MPAATSHALTAGFRPTVPPRSVPVSPSPAGSVGHTGHPGHLLRPHTDPAPCSPRAGGAVAAQESRLHVRTHAAAARWSATRSLTLRSPNPTPKATGTRQSNSHTYLKAQSGRASLEGGGLGVPQNQKGSLLGSKHSEPAGLPPIPALHARAHASTLTRGLPTPELPRGNSGKSEPRTGHSGGALHFAAPGKLVLPPASSAVGRAGAGEEGNASYWCRVWRGHVTRRRPSLALIFSCHSREMFGVGEVDTPPARQPWALHCFSHTSTIKKNICLA